MKLSPLPQNYDVGAPPCSVPSYLNTLPVNSQIMRRTHRAATDEINEDQTRPYEPGSAFLRKTILNWSHHLTRHGMRIEKITTRNPAYEFILAIRAEAYGRDQLGVPCPLDPHSTLWLLWLNETPIGTIRGTRAVDGEMDCEQHFPPRIRRDFTAIIASASRFCLRRGIPAHMCAARILTEVGFRRQAVARPCLRAGRVGLRSSPARESVDTGRLTPFPRYVFAPQTVTC